MRSSLIRVLAPLLLLCLPLLVLGVWLTKAKGPQSLAAFNVSIGLVSVLVAMLTRSWRLFFLIQLPVLLLSAAFAIYTLSYGAPPGEFLAYVLATSSWEEIRGFFGIWQGMRWLLVMSALALIYLLLAAWAPARSIFAGSSIRGRWGFISAVILLSAYAARSPAAFIDGIAANPGLGTAMFVAGPLGHTRARLSRW